MTVSDRIFGILQRLPGKPLLHVNLIILLTMVIPLVLILWLPTIGGIVGSIADNVLPFLLGISFGYMSAQGDNHRYMQQRLWFLLRSVALGLGLAIFFYEINAIIATILAPPSHGQWLIQTTTGVVLCLFLYILMVGYRLYTRMRTVLLTVASWQEQKLIDREHLETHS